ncbi:hypothetical protein AA21291_1979 [Swaminathania salitolerans LMG 21291]|nr:hypothetical protein AA21291_1979 [Swaminathania salitolerans LMG 21291]
MGFVTLEADGRFHITPAGLNRHDQEIGQLKPMSARASRHRAVRHRADRRSGTDRNGL